MARVVITGAAGNLGSKLAKHFSAVGSGHDLILLDRVEGEGTMRLTSAF